MFGHMGAFESTNIHGCGEDILGTTHHIERWKHDLDLLYDSGVRNLRYSAPWHRIECVRGEYNFEWFDGPMRHMERLGMRPILDPLHHTSFPDWLQHGLGDPELPVLYTRFVSELERRYPWVLDYTIVNEPFPTTLFCSLTGMWFPRGKTDAEFVRMAVNVGKTICSVSAMLRSRRPDVQLIHIDTCEWHQALDRKVEPWVDFANERRFVMHDLILGRVRPDHPMYEYLSRYGFSTGEEQWFQDHPAPFDMLGLDYYCHSEMEWLTGKHSDEMRRPVAEPRGFASLCQDYQQRFGGPMLLAETNLRGTVTDRISWLRLMEEQYQGAIGAGVDLRGFCWYPSIDTTDWSNCCTRLTHAIDPQGIWGLDEKRWRRQSSELSELYGALARGEITWQDLPVYPFTSPLDRELSGFVRLSEDAAAFNQEQAA